MKDIMKKTVQNVLCDEYGFHPTMKQIVLLEGSDDLCYIRFRVGTHEYVYDGETGIEKVS